jgi:hypothetical protein
MTEIAFAVRVANQRRFVHQALGNKSGNPASSVTGKLNMAFRPQNEEESMKKSICLFVLLMTLLCATAQAQESVRVPRGKAILIDGKFSPGEWQDSTEVALSDSVKLYVKASEQYAYVCVRLVKEKNFGVDMYLADSTKEIHNLHVSAKLGERLLKNNAYPEWQWWNNRDWAANVSRVFSFDERKFLPDEVKEMQISRHRFKGKQWLAMFEIHASDGSQSFPAKAVNNQSTNWLRLEFK